MPIMADVFALQSKWPTLLTAPVTVAYTTTARTALLPAGTYFVATSSAAHINQGGSTVNATTSNMPVAANDWHGPFRVTGATDGYFAAVQQSAGGTLFAVKVSE